MSKSYRDLFKGTAWYYARYRYGYSPEYFKELARRLGLDGKGRLLDLGCGTGQLTVPLAAYFEEVVGVDPEPEMLEQATHAAQQARVKNVRWVEGGAADLASLGLGSFRVVSMGNSFHWMDQYATLLQLDRMVEPGGKLVIVGTSSGSVIYNGREDWTKATQEILQRMVGETRQPGSAGYMTPVETFEEVLARSPFSRVEIFEMEDTRLLTTEQVIGFLYSTSYASKAVLGNRWVAFEQAIRHKLHEINPEDKFADKISIGTFIAERPVSRPTP